MEPFQGTVFRDGQVVLPRVSGTLEQHASAGPDPSWSGVFIIPVGQHIGAGGPFVLALDDGRSGEITICDVSPDDASEPLALDDEGRTGEFILTDTSSWGRSAPIARFEGFGPIR